MDRYWNRTLSCGRYPFHDHVVTYSDGLQQRFVFHISELSFAYTLVVVNLDSANLFGEIETAFYLTVERKSDGPMTNYKSEEELVEIGEQIIEHLGDYQNRLKLDAFHFDDKVIVLDHHDDYLENHAFVFTFNGAREMYIAHAFYYTIEHDDWYERATDALEALPRVIAEEKEIYTNDEDYGPRTKL